MKPLIHDRLAGKTVQAVLTNGRELIVQCTTGEEIVIGWGLDGPVFLRQDARLVLPTASAAGIGDNLAIPGNGTPIFISDLLR